MRRLLFSLLVLALPCSALDLTRLPATGAQPVIPTPQGGQQKPYAESHAIVFSVADYEDDGWMPISKATLEADQVADALRLNGFDVWRVRNPSRADFDQVLTEFMAQHGHTPKSRVIVYFNGHGYTREDQAGYIVLRDAGSPTKNKTAFFKGAYPIRSFLTLADEIEAVHSLFIFDSCFSGSIFGAKGDTPESSPPEGRVPRYRLLTEKPQPVRQVITAGRANETVPQQGNFTPYLVKALTAGLASSPDGYLTGKELGVWLMESIPAATKSKQHPVSDVVRNSAMIFGDMIFAPPSAVRAATLESPPVVIGRSVVYNDKSAPVNEQCMPEVSEMTVSIRENEELRYDIPLRFRIPSECTVRKVSAKGNVLGSVAWDGKLLAYRPVKSGIEKIRLDIDMADGQTKYSQSVSLQVAVRPTQAGPPKSIE